MSEERINDLEEALAHLLRTVDDLSDVATDQAKRIERLERRIALLLERAAEEDAEKGAHVFGGSDKPPHY
ncbi:MAG: SlyX family protein [Rubricella sp.]